MNYRQRAILVGILRDVERLSRLPLQGGRDYAIERYIIADAKLGLVRCNPAEWLGHELTASDRTMVSQAYKQLAEQGFIERHAAGSGGRQLTHVSLTPAGKIAAQHLADAEQESLCANPTTQCGPSARTPAEDPNGAAEGAADG